MQRSPWIIGWISFAFLWTAAHGEGADWHPGSRAEVAQLGSAELRMDRDLGRMPLYFIPNRGQTDEEVAFYIQGKGKTLYFTSEGITFALAALSGERRAQPRSGREGPESRVPGKSVDRAPEAVERWVVKLEYVGADKNVKPVGATETGAIVSYFKSKPEDWRTALPTYSEIVYRDLWPGIDLVYYGTLDRLKYEFIVHPWADPSRIRLAYRGARSVSVDGDGRLQVTTPGGGFSDDAPRAYQEINGQKTGVSLAYKLEPLASASEGTESTGRAAAKDFMYGFEVGDYDPTRPLILDPAILIYCGYIGGSLNDYGYGIAVDGSGNAYLTGYTDSVEITFPETVGPDLTYNGGTYDAFVAKVNAAGTGLVYCGYIGGSNYDEATGIAVDASGNAYVIGDTYSTESTFPVTGGPDTSHNGNLDVFVAKVNPAGTGLVYCGYVGGSLNEFGSGIAIDGAGSAYLTGYTDSSESTFPVTAGPDLTFNGGLYDAFVTKVNAAGTGLVYCGYIGGIFNDYGSGIAIDASGNAYVAGETNSNEATFPVTAGPDLTFNGGPLDAFVAKVGSSGAALAYCGYVGGSGSDTARAVAVDVLGNAYLAGYTGSTQTTFPETVGPDLTHNGNTDAFVAKVNAAGTSLAYCGFIGGSGNDYGRAIALDNSGNAYVAGNTFSTEGTFPVTMGPDLTFNGAPGADDAFAARVIASGTALDYCGYIGGSLSDVGLGMAVDKSGNAYITGFTGSNQTTFPVTAGPDLTHNGAGDLFVTKIYFYAPLVHRHAAGDFDGDAADELAVDFGTLGAWLWDNGSWSQLTPNNPDSMTAANVDGNNDEEILLDLGSAGLWLWNGGPLTLLSGLDVDILAAGDIDADGSDEVVADFGASGLWLWNGGTWSQLSGANLEYLSTADVDGTGGADLVCDFGGIGLWIWSGGSWTQLSGVNADDIDSGNTDGAGGADLVGDFGPVGLWLWAGGAWTQLSGVNADDAITADIDHSGDDEIIGDFALAGLWLWDSGAWTQLSGVNADGVSKADVDGDGADEIVADFSVLGLWLWNGGTWSQISGVNAEGLLAGDVDADGNDELIVDFGALGLWIWNGGAWSQISASNPD